MAESALLNGSNGSIYPDVQGLFDGGKDCREILHGWIAGSGKHSVKTFTRFLDFLGQSLESDSCVNEVS